MVSRFDRIPTAHIDPQVQSCTWQDARAACELDDLDRTSRMGNALSAAPLLADLVDFDASVALWILGCATATASATRRRVVTAVAYVCPGLSLGL